MSKSPFKISGMSTDLNLSRLGNFSFSNLTPQQRLMRASVNALNAKKNQGDRAIGLAGMRGLMESKMLAPSSSQDSNLQTAPGLSNIPSIDNSINNVSNQVVDQVLGSMPNESSSLVNPFGLNVQNAIGGAFGSLFDRQKSMGSALAKRACKYKNKK